MPQRLNIYIGHVNVITEKFGRLQSSRIQKACYKLSIMGNSDEIDDDQCNKINKALKTTFTKLQIEVKNKDPC